MPVVREAYLTRVTTIRQSEETQWLTDRLPKWARSTELKLQDVQVLDGETYLRPGSK